MTLPAERAPAAADWRKLSDRWRAELGRRMTKLRDQLDDCIGCGCLSPVLCPLRNPWEELSEQGSRPRLLDPD